MSDPFSSPTTSEAAPDDTPPPGAESLLHLWFGLSAPVGRRAYALSGFGLMIAKYLIDASIIYFTTGRSWTPLDYLNPLFQPHHQAMEDSPEWILFAMLVWSLPFMWIGASMTVRRAVDAGWSAWLGLLFFLPIVNYGVMLVLAFSPSRRPHAWQAPALEPVMDDRLKSAFLGIAVGLGIAFVMVLASVFVVGTYGAVLFFGTPFIMGASSAYLFNQGHPRTQSSTVSVALACIGISAGCTLLFALEGVLCVAMAAPIAAGTGIMGAFLGRAIAIRNVAPTSHLTMVILALPFLAGAESASRSSPINEVLSTIEIDATPEQVWPNVIGFSELSPPPEWFFRLGIAYPQHATIDGAGVGAVRHCVFSTGAFVEPITRWEAPHHLAFDVASQPPPMEQWSPYWHVYMPHIDGYIQSRRGEFLLIPLEGGRTRIEARTWYDLTVFPQSYWSLWTNSLVSAIHDRVLEHIRDETEAGAATAMARAD